MHFKKYYGNSTFRVFSPRFLFFFLNKGDPNIIPVFLEHMNKCDFTEISKYTQQSESKSLCLPTSSGKERSKKWAGMPGSSC